MSIPSRDTPPAQLHRIWLNTLYTLFRCLTCGETLVPELPFATSKDGTITDVRCPQCGDFWAFARIPQGLYEKQQLSHKDLAAIEDRLDTYVGRISSGTATCARCGRELTNPDSIAAGIGPICAEKVGPEGRKAAFWGNTYHGTN